MLILPVVGGLLYLVAYAHIDAGLRPQLYDFGIVREGVELEHVFTIGNPSLRTVKIEGVRASCACLVSKELPKQIRSLSPCRIPVTLRTIGKSGEVNQKVAVALEGLPAVVLLFRGTVIRDVPRIIEFGKIMRGQASQREFLLNAFPGVDLLVNDVEYDHEYFDVNYDLEGSNRRNFRFVVKLRGDMDSGPFAKVLSIQTNDTVSPMKQIEIRGYVLKAVECQTNTLAFGMVAPAQRNRRS